MDYKQAIEFIYSREMFANSSGFERIEALLEKLGNPHKKMKYVHIVGTNGKGSTSVMLYEILRDSGFKAGLFTSPYVTEFRERIAFDGEYISCEDFAAAVEKIRLACSETEKDGIVPTFFETVFATAVYYYAEKGCEIAVIEAGIGGREDSTNIIPPPLAAVITSVSLDHTAVLGNTVSEIAAAKSGVIKKGCFAVSFPRESCGLDFQPQTDEAVAELEKTAEKEGCSLIFPEVRKVSQITGSLSGTSFSYDGGSYKIRFTGDHQIANAITAITVAENLEKQLGITAENIRRGLSRAFLPARMEIVSSSPTVIIDGGHNEGCMRALSKMIRKHLPERKITAVLGFMRDKDYKASLEIIAPLCENIVFTIADEQRGEKSMKLKEAAEGLCENLFCDDSIASALDKAKSLCQESGVLLCAGSFYLVSEIRKNFSL